jgi:hypothetical protein
MRCLFHPRLAAALFLFPCLLIISSSSLVVGQWDERDEPDKVTLNLFAAYPRSEALQYIAYSHAAHKVLARQRKILYATWFLEGNPKVAMQCLVDNRGQVFTVRSVYDWAEQGGEFRQLTEQQLKSLTTTLEDLPLSAQSPPLAFLVVLTLKHGDRWLTRIYDRRNPPEEVRKIYEITGAAMETTK